MIKIFLLHYLIFSFPYNFSNSNLTTSKDQDLRDQLEMSTYSADSSASAVILHDIGASSFDFNHPEWGTEMRFERKLRIKILKKEGYDWANIEIPLYRNNEAKEDLQGLKAITYNLVDGKVVKTKFNRSDILREETNENWTMLKISMPEIREGSVFEVSYYISSPFIFNLQSWKFQHSIPVVMSEYEVAIPEYLQYNVNMRGYYPLTSHPTSSRPGRLNSQIIGSSRSLRSGNQITTSQAVNYINNVQKWSADNVPAFIPEPYTDCETNYMSAITFELSHTKWPGSPVHTYTTSWEAINDKFLASESFGGELKRVNYFKKEVEALVSDAGAPLAKAIIINQHLSQKMQWDEKNRSFVSQPLRKTYEQGVGNSADINLLQVAMLRAAGLKAYPVVLSTRDHGIIFPTNPTITSFNYVIAALKIEDNLYLLDATDKHLAPGTLPLRCLNGKGRLISESQGEWVTLHSEPAVTKVLYELRATEGNLVGKCRESYQKRAAYTYARSQPLDQDGKQFAKSREENDSKLTVENIEIKSPEHGGDPIQINYQLTLKDSYMSAGDKIYLNPMTNRQMEKNPFKLAERAYPVNFGYPIDEFYLMRFAVPSGFQVESIPEGINMKLPEDGGKYIYEVKESGDFLIVTSRLQINKPVFLPSEYQALKKFYDLAIGKQAEQIVLSKL